VCVCVCVSVRECACMYLNRVHICTVLTQTNEDIKPLLCSQDYTTSYTHVQALIIQLFVHRTHWSLLASTFGRHMLLCSARTCK